MSRHPFRPAFAKAGVHVTRLSNETESAMAKDAVLHATVNCELMKARATIRAKMIVKDRAR